MASNSQLINAARAPELIKKIWITIGLLAVYRMGVFVPTPGVNAEALKQFLSQSASLFGVFNAFSGGALARFSVFALGIMPYITSSIIFSLLTVVSPQLSQLQKEGGELGRKKINQFTRYGTVIVAIVQAITISSWLSSNPNGMQIVERPGFQFTLLTVITLTAGTCFIMWLGEQITQRGIGNGTSLIIFASIVSSFPNAVSFLWEKVSAGEMGGGEFFMFALVAIGVIAVIVFIERAQRRIPVHYAKRVVGRRMYGASMSFLPLKVNMAGVIPPIFAQSILLFPGTLAGFLGNRFPELKQVTLWFLPGNWVYIVTYVVGIVFFSYFYTAIQVNPEDLAENVKKSGGFVPGIRPGKNTADFIDRVLTRLTTAGAVYISAICVLPFVFFSNFQVFLGGTSLLIVVGVALQFFEQVQSHLMTQQYDSYLNETSARSRQKSSRFKARRGA